MWLILIPLIAGIGAIYYGYFGLLKGEIPLYPGKTLKGFHATLAGLLCMLVGFAFLAYFWFMAREFPEGLGH